MTNEDLQQIQNLVNSARKVLILTHKNPGVDAMASALAIYLAMVKMGKDATIAMESTPLVEVASLVGIDKVVTALGGAKNLLITYQPYNLGDFTSVRYLEDQGQAGNLNESFKLTITPRDGFVPDSKNFQFSMTGGAGGNFDLIFTVEVLEPTQVGTLYDANLFAASPIINIDNHDPNRDYGKFNLVEPDAASISEIVTFFLRAVNTQIDGDIAGNLYQGIATATSNFQSPKVAAATFEAAAICLRAGAKGKGTPAQPQTANTPIQPQSMPNVQPSVSGQPVSSPVPPSQPANVRNNGVPEDWTQPKSYRGTSTV